MGPLCMFRIAWPTLASQLTFSWQRSSSGLLLLVAHLLLLLSRCVFDRYIRCEFPNSIGWWIKLLLFTSTLSLDWISLYRIGRIWTGWGKRIIYDRRRGMFICRGEFNFPLPFLCRNNKQNRLMVFFTSPRQMDSSWSISINYRAVILSHQSISALIGKNW